MVIYMKTITMFMMKTCPYCQEAFHFMDKLYSENDAYKALTVNFIDETEHPEIADKYDYYRVPTYYVGDEKLHEGIAELKDVRRVFDTALIS